MSAGPTPDRRSPDAASARALSGLAVASLAGMALLVALLSFGVAWQGLQIWRKGPQNVPPGELAKVEGTLAESRLEGAGAKQVLRLRLVEHPGSYVVRRESLSAMNLDAFRREVSQGTPLQLRVRDPGGSGDAGSRQERLARRGREVLAVATAQRSYLSLKRSRDQAAGGYAWMQLLVLPVVGVYAVLVLIVLVALRRRRRASAATAEQC